MAKKRESTPGENLAKQIIEQYKPKSVADMQDALKDIFGPMFEAMLQGEMNNHLGYESNDHGIKTTDNRRNGYTNKKVKTSAGEVDIKVPRDRDLSFEISHETLSQITDCVLDKLDDWQNRPLKRMYTFLFADYMYVTIRKEYESKNYAE